MVFLKTGIKRVIHNGYKKRASTLLSSCTIDALRNF